MRHLPIRAPAQGTIHVLEVSAWNPSAILIEAIFERERDPANCPTALERSKMSSRVLCKLTFSLGSLVEALADYDLAALERRG